MIRDIVYALAHDLRTPLVAADVTMKQALAGAYGNLPDRYGEILRATVAANEEERHELESYLMIEYLMELVKLEAHQQLRQQAS